MQVSTIRRIAYWLAALLALAYVVYVLGSKFLASPGSPPIGELGEAGLVLASVVAFSIGLLADEALRSPSHE